MKFVSVILAFLILAMAMMPCQEDSEMEKGGIEVTSKSKAEKHETPEDNCNSFCHCSRCPFSVIIPETGQLISVKKTMSAYDTDLKSTVIHVSFAFWQPPKLA